MEKVEVATPAKASAELLNLWAKTQIFTQYVQIPDSQEQQKVVVYAPVAIDSSNFSLLVLYLSNHCEHLHLSVLYRVSSTACLKKALRDQNIAIVW